MGTVRRIFDDELNQMNAQFTKMGFKVNESILKAVKAFINHDKTLATEVKDNDRDINAMEVDLEQFCFQLIALQQPVSADLRSIITVMKASSDLERMGDHAVSIARSVIRVKEKHSKRIPEVEVKIGEMAEVVKLMVEQSIDAYVKGDVAHAKEIAARDSIVDDYFVNINRFCLKEMAKDPEVIFGGADYILVAGYLERIGDYVTNICERILYLQTGKLEELN